MRYAAAGAVTDLASVDSNVRRDARL